MQYLFGDTDIAAHRLKLVAEVFADSTRTFLLDAGLNAPQLALDLGCGPGYTTHLLAEVLRPEHTAGLDDSEHFISLAQRTGTDTVSFYLHDVTAVPFPVGPSDLLFCRFLLTHLKNPLFVIARWATQLRPKGLMLMQEVEWINTDNTAFTTYLKIVEAMLAHQSNELYAGRLLADFEHADIFNTRVSHVSRLQVANRDAATMFLLNMQSWRDRPVVRENYSVAMLQGLEKDLHDLTNDTNNTSNIEWGLREVAYERA